jgi:hypothetical protein
MLNLNVLLAHAFEPGELRYLRSHHEFSRLLAQAEAATHPAFLFEGLVDAGHRILTARDFRGEAKPPAANED